MNISSIARATSTRIRPNTISLSITPSSNNTNLFHTIPHHHRQVVGRSGKIYSSRTVKIVETIGRVLGYTLQKSTAVTLTSDYYDRCADRFNQEKQFWIKECGLPDSFQTWFQVTQLHMWLLTVRFRSMKSPLGRYYIQEFVNHSFIDIEERMRGPSNKITKGTLIKKYMKDLLNQHRGFQLHADWAISRTLENESDQFLAALIWRNLFGAAWGGGMGGVNGIFDSNFPNSPELAVKSSPTTPIFSSFSDSLKPQVHSFDNDVKFAQILERMVTFIRKELVRLDQVSDQTIISSPSSRQSSPSASNPIGLTQFNKI